MTLSEIQASIVEYLTSEKKDFVTLSEETLKKLSDVNTKENKDKTGKFKEEVIPSIELALDELAKKGLFCKSTSNPANPIWVLVRPLESYPQTVEVGKSTADAMANAINEYCKRTDNRKDLADPLQINEYDIQKLIMIISKLNDVLIDISEEKTVEEEKAKIIVA